VAQRLAAGARRVDLATVTAGDPYRHALGLDLPPGQRPAVVLYVGHPDGYAPLAAAARGRVRAAVLIGVDHEQIRRPFAAAGIPTEHAESMEEAVRKAAHRALIGDVVLLSPACASFDMFQNYEHRGEVFKDVVRRIVPSGSR